ncbi:MAG: HAMP domain-containing histidine kinase [Ruminococcus sp.]|nr:HAMP domain-containing histidine kinase [Ruminococcus sp.]
MKKQYRIITLVINLLLLVLFVVVEGVYTYETATKIMNKKWERAQLHAQMSITNPDFTSPDTNMIYQVHYDVASKSWNGLYDVGYYEFFLRDDGKKIESCNHLFLSFAKVGTSSVTDNKYIYVGPDFKNNNRGTLHHFKIDAMCDENFIFNGTITAEDNYYQNGFEYTIGENELASAEDAVHIHDWIKQKENTDSMEVVERALSLYTIAEYYPVAETEYEVELCDEAKKKLEEVIDKVEKGYVIKTNNYGSISYSGHDDINERMENGEITSYSQKELGTSFYISHRAINSDTDNAYIIYLFHPLEITFRNNIKKYITSLIVFILLEIFVVIVMRKLYSNRMKYELMRRDLTRSIAHDLKTPLAITKAYTENWEYIDEKDRHRYAERLHSEIDNTASIINDMINMSKFDSKQDLKLEKVELRSMVSEILERMKPIISERELDVRFFTDKDDEMYSVLADPKMIRIAINNFITNAVKYAESTITVELYSNKKKIKFVIGNDGKTISKKDIRKIWEPFYKGDKARTDRIGSSGMGLAINSSILRLHKAKHKCTSKNGRTTFWFEIKRMDKNGK